MEGVAGGEFAVNALAHPTSICTFVHTLINLRDDEDLLTILCFFLSQNVLTMFGTILYLKEHFLKVYPSCRVVGKLI